MGKEADLSDFVRLEREHRRWAAAASDGAAAATTTTTTTTTEEAEEETDAEIEARLRKLNAHLPHVKDPMNADYVNYWDVVGLYSHSSKSSSSSFSRGVWLVGPRASPLGGRANARPPSETRQRQLLGDACQQLRGRGGLKEGKDGDRRDTRG